MYDFDEIINRKNTGASKWESGPDGSRLPEDIIPLWVADMDFPCAPPIVEALHKAVDNRIYGYSQFPDGYFEALQSFYERRHHFHVEKENMLFTTGVVPALHYVIKALSDPGDGVITMSPVYYPFFSAIQGEGRELLENRLINKDGAYTIDFDDLEKLACEPRAKILLICSPHNPVGRVWTVEELT
ncbi:MAG: aminotransferase class I/II-fold pyridoxal phosphate-dependent enzyme, partial [Oscillospiraceae bacterium]|nr:aminotransferase class I/II-fold pyridoxal phosphate-dependent enzyme [Oscillospiraceae bacterium]